MVNFRYHIVSIVAVFLALGIGILVGTTVVNDQTLQFLRDRIDNANKRVDDVQHENSLLRHELDDQRDLADGFAEEIAPTLLDGRLRDVPVLLLAARGVEDGPIDDLRTALASATARYEGTVWFTDRLRLEDDKDRNELAAILGVRSTEADAVRLVLARSLAAALLGRQGGSPTLLSDLLNSGFLDYQKPGSDAPDTDALPLPGSRFAVVGGAGAEVPDDAVLRPLVDAMADTRTVPVVVASAGPHADDDDVQRTEATALVQGVRDDDTIADRVSTVDNLAVFPGQAATVLALQDLGRGIVGHYGVGDGSDGLLPPEAP